MGFLGKVSLQKYFAKISMKFSQPPRNVHALPWRKDCMCANFRNFPQSFHTTSCKNPFANDPISELRMFGNIICTHGRPTEDYLPCNELCSHGKCLWFSKVCFGPNRVGQPKSPPHARVWEFSFSTILKSSSPLKNSTPRPHSDRKTVPRGNLGRSGMHVFGHSAQFGAPFLTP